MSLNPKYIVAPALQQHFTDKDTGDFLRNGYVLFFKDNARTIGKPVYKLTGAPPSYNYIANGYYDSNGAWRVDLNLQGAFDDIIYWYPYDANGDLELYFVQVYSSDASVFPLPGILQFSVQAYPNVTQGSNPSGTAIDVNYVPDGQFLLHTNLAKDGTYEVNEIRSPITNIDYGGWTFERPNSSTAKDFVQFERFGSFISNPDGNPRYSVRISTESPDSGDTFKDLRLLFEDVNKFASSDTTKQFTFSFVAQTNAGGSLPVSFIVYKNYGTGGSTPTETPVQNFNIANSYTQYTASFSFGDNSSKVLGNANDDYLQLIIRFPVDTIFDVSLTDFILTDGAVSQPLFPDTPNNEFKYRAIAGFMPVPAYDGSDVYLPLRLTPIGLEFDKSDIGKIYSAAYKSPAVGELICDGSQYETDKKSTDGIPYSRLQSVLWNQSAFFPQYGTGANYVTSLGLSSDTSTMMLQTNTEGAVTAPLDGTPATGFTFFNIFTSVSSYPFKSIYLGTNSLYLWFNLPPVSNYTFSSGTSGFTLTSYTPLATFNTQSPLVRQILNIQTTAATGLAGKYFDFLQDANAWYVWFTVDGIGTDPLVPSSTGIKVELKSTYTSTDVARAVTFALNSFQSDAITMLAGSSVPPGSYWTFNTTTLNFYVWYTVDGAGTDPAPLNKTAIKVDVLSTDTAPQVVQKTIIAINSKYFAVPDLRGIFLRGLDDGANIDPWNNPVVRGAQNGIVFGDDLGTIEFDANQDHRHFIELPQQILPAGGAPGANIWEQGSGTQIESNLSGNKESRPINQSVMYVIKY